MERITLATQTMFAELTQRCLDAEFDALYDERGSFVKKQVKGAPYWYYQRRVAGSAHSLYVGPVRDEAITQRVEQFATVKDDFKQRREMVRALLAIGLLPPDGVTGAVIEALWQAGFFRLRGVLVGTLAFQTYSGLVGAKLSGASLVTQDADLAQFYDISQRVGDSMPPILEVLKKVDPTFRAIGDQRDPLRVTRFRTSGGYAVEFLTPNRGSDDNQGRPAKMPALGGASATPLRFLDYLIHDPIRSVVLYKGGVPVTVPKPERYAVHKIIVAAARHDTAVKASKDLMQALQIIEASKAQRSFDITEAWQEAWDRGPSWRTHLKQGLSMLRDDDKVMLLDLLDKQGWREKTATNARKRVAKPTTKKKVTAPRTKKSSKKKT
jgi:hypothetical protein